MATKVSALTRDTAPSTDDYVLAVDNASSTSKKVTMGDLVQAGLPTQTSNSGKFLTTNGTVASWATVTGFLTSGDIGVTVQAFSANLTTWAGKTAPTGTVVGTSDTQTLTGKTLTAPIIATISNTGTLTLPTSTDTLIGKATTDTLTNKTFDTAGTGNVFKINGVTISANTGTGSNVLATSPTLTTPNLGTPSTLTLTNATGLPVAGISATGTPSSTTYLRGDGTWATVSGGSFTSPMTTLGDILYEDATPTAARLAGNTTTTKKFLTQTGTGTISAVPAWGVIGESDVTNLTTDLAAKATDSLVVHLAGSETITGVKNFTNAITQTMSGGVAYSLTNSGTSAGILVTQNGNTGTTLQSSGAIVIDNTNNTDIGFQVYTNQGASQTYSPVLIYSANTAMNNPLVRLISTGTGGNTAMIRMDGASPKLEFIETDQAAPAGKYALQINGDIMRFQGRVAADNAFEDGLFFTRPAIQGGFGIGISPFGVEKFTIAAGTGDAPRMALGETTAPSGGTTGYGKVYVKSSDHNLYYMNQSGVEVQLGSGGTGDMVLASIQTVTGAKTFNDGKLILAGATSGTTTLKSGAIAGSSVITLPIATDTLVGLATSDTLTNKTMSGASNTFSAIPESAITNLTTDLSAKATDSLVVHLAGGETISGAKTFSAAPVLNALPTGTAVASAATVSTLVTRDANGNINTVNTFEGFATTPTAGGTTALTITSKQIQEFTGTLAQTVTLPTTSVPAGGQYIIVNSSTGAVTVQSSGANTITILAAGTTATFTALIATPTTAGNWGAQYLGLAIANSKKLTISNTLTLAGTDATTMTFPATTGNVIASVTGIQTVTGTPSSSNFLRGDGTWATPAGSGTVTATGGSLTANSLVLGAGTTDTKVVAGIVSDGTSKITLGVAGTSVGAVAFNNATSGTITLQPVTGALGSITLSLPATTDTLVGKTTVDTLTNKSLTSPTLTGTPVSPTAAVSNNTTQVATTAYVDRMGPIGVGTAGFKDDFINNFGSGSVTTATGIDTDSGWIAVQVVGGTQTLSSSSDSTFTNPGQLTMTASAISGQGLALFKGNSGGGSGVVGALGSNGGWELHVITKLSQTTLCSIRFGVAKSGTAATDSPTDGIYYEYNTANTGNSDTKFTGVTRSASTSTYTTTNQIAADTAFHHFRIRSTSAGTIGFTVDGGTEDTTSTNVSTANMTPFFQILSRTTATKAAVIDYFSFLAATGRT